MLKYSFSRKVKKGEKQVESIDEPQIQKDLFGDIINPAENLADDVVSNKKANKKILLPSPPPG